MKQLFISITVLLSSISVRAQVEDYLQYAPLAAYITLNACDTPAKNAPQDRVFSFLTSVIATYGTTGALKHIVSERRPNGCDNKSFPSGHAARSFMAANMLRHEFGHISPWISIAGYSCAAVTSVLRITGDYHYTHDVLAGAAIGILSTELSYAILPIWKKWRSGRRKKRLGKKNEDIQFVVLPTIGNGGLSSMVVGFWF